MKRLLIPLLLLSIVLAGCGSNKLSQDELFQKKQECANLRDKMQEQFSRYKSGGVSPVDCFNIVEVFYSPLRNSCLYIAQNRGGCGWGLTGGDDELIFDYFTNQMILEIDNIGGNSSTVDTYRKKSDKVCFPIELKDVNKESNSAGYFRCMKTQFDMRLKELKGE